MKHKTTLLFATSCLLINTISAKMDTVSIGKAFDDKRVKLIILSKGGHTGQCISMNIKSQYNDSMLLFIEAGRKLDSKDSTQQDILIVKDVFVPLASNQQKTVDVTGFCCQAHNGSPRADSIFFVGSLKDKKLYELGRYLNKAKLDNGSIQYAVWAISDDNEVSSIGDDGTAEVANLRKFVSKLKNLPIEFGWYSIYYKKVKGQLFSGVPEKVTGHFDYYISDFSHVYLNIRDAQGTVVKSFEVSKAAERGSYTYNLNWDASKNRAGVYSVRLYENGKELKKLAINLK